MTVQDAIDFIYVEFYKRKLGLFVEKLNFVPEIYCFSLYQTNGKTINKELLQLYSPNIQQIEVENRFLFSRGQARRI